MQKVVLVTDGEGNVREVFDSQSGDPISYDIKAGDSGSEDVLEGVHLMCTPQSLPPRVIRALNTSIGKSVAHVIPLPHVEEHEDRPTGCVFLLKSRELPDDTGDPLHLGYGKGISLVEVRARMEDGTFLSRNFVDTPEFQKRLRDAEDALKEPSGSPPGLFLPKSDAHDVISKHCTSPSFPDDPLLRKFNPFFFKNWVPHLAENDFARFYMSDWETVHETTCVSFGHTRGEPRFYIVVRWDLPAEMTDQLLQLVSVNPCKETWKELAERDEFKKAVDISQKVRQSLAERFAKLIGVSLRLADRRFVHTMSNVLVSNANVSVPGTNGEKRAAVAYYEGCAPTHTSQGGIVTLSSSDPRETVFWWHGPPTPDDPGGEPWDVRDGGNAWPMIGSNLVWKKGTLSMMSSAGYLQGNGFAKLAPVLKE